MPSSRPLPLDVERHSDATAVCRPLLHGGGRKRRQRPDVAADRARGERRSAAAAGGSDTACATRPSRVCSSSKRSLVNFGATSMATLLQMVSHDMGMTLIPEMAIATETSRNTIRIVPFAEPQPSRDIGLAWRRSNHRGQGDGGAGGGYHSGRRHSVRRGGLIRRGSSSGTATVRPRARSAAFLS